MKTNFKKFFDGFFSIIEIKSINSIVIILAAVLFAMLFSTGSYLINQQRGKLNPMPYVQHKTVNINTAGAAELAGLPGIGAVFAERITEYREKNGPFRKKEDIMKVKGISEGRFNKIKELISCE
jgi:comEA protein